VGARKVFIKKGEGPGTESDTSKDDDDGVMVSPAIAPVMPQKPAEPAAKPATKPKPKPADDIPDDQKLD
jgi:hypothetical protein